MFRDKHQRRQVVNTFLSLIPEDEPDDVDKAYVLLLTQDILLGTTKTPLIGLMSKVSRDIGVTITGFFHYALQGHEAIDLWCKHMAEVAAAGGPELAPDPTKENGQLPLPTGIPTQVPG